MTAPSRDDRRAIARQAQVALDVAGVFEAKAFRIRIASHEIGVQRTRDGRGFAWKCHRCGTVGSFVGVLWHEGGQPCVGDADHIPLARFVGEHTREACPTSTRP